MTCNLVAFVSVNVKFIYGGSFRKSLLILMKPTQQQETNILPPIATRKSTRSS